MRIAPLLLAGALLFWGWQTDFLPWAALMAVILESSRLVKSRLSFSDTDLNRIWDLCGLLFVGAYVVIKTSHEIRLPVFVFPQWLPFVFFPMMLAQAFGSAPDIGMKTFSWLLRWRKAESGWATRRINFSYIYLAICIFGSSTTNKFGAAATEDSFNWFYAGLACLVSWALFTVRPRRVPLPLWLCILALIMGTGFFAQKGLHEAHSKIEAEVGSWIVRLLGKRRGSTGESRTSIGRIGRLKLSGKIILRVEPEEKKSPPDLLRETTFVTYKNEAWYANRPTYQELTTSKNDAWSLSSKPADQAATIYGYLENKTGILPLPLGTAEITNLPAVLKQNSLGTVRVEEGPGFISYYVRFGPDAAEDSEPTGLDGEENIPENESDTITKVAHDLGLDTAKSDREKLKIIGKYFADQFTYSTYISEQHVDPTGQKSPLSIFLERTHSGHCEYFATATVLLARAANIPARYAVGYSVQESAKSGNSFIVRERHAHAWSLIWNREKSVWENFDTTPASWDKIEEQHASAFQFLSDAWSRFLFEFSKWRYGKTDYQQYLIWALIPLVLILIWRIVFNKERTRARKVGDSKEKQVWPGLDSEFYAIEAELTRMGYARRNGESLLSWRNRLAKSNPLFNEDLDSILKLHRRHRFDPRGLSLQERQSLTAAVQSWLTESAKQEKLRRTPVGA